MARTPQEIFQHHTAALMAGDVEEFVADYDDDSLIIAPSGVLRGRDGVRAFFTDMLGQLPNATLQALTQIFEGDVLFLEWTADSDKAQVRDGVDTFVFRGDSIGVQTVHCTVEPLS
jgi:predicted SnoaL-like aldol condensation-catalyzing enzyme